MNRFAQFLRKGALVTTLAGLAATPGRGRAETVTNEIRIVALAGHVQVLAAGAGKWIAITATNQSPLQPGDRIRTGPDSRVVLDQNAEGIITLDALTEIEILAPRRPADEQGLHLFRGIFSFFHRGKPGHIRVITSGALAGIEGTDFVMRAIEEAGVERTTLSVIDGQVRLENPLGTLILTNGQQAVAEPGKAPMRTAGFYANNLLQWCFYYPAVLDLKDLSLTPDEEQALSQSLGSYRAGDLLEALKLYPTNRTPASDSERLYHAALLLSVGQVSKAQTDLAASTHDQRQADALRTLIAAVKRESKPSSTNYQLSSEYLAKSYYEQSQAVPDASLKTALALAKQAVARSPRFGFAWERVAELEFSFGRTDCALATLNKSLEISPRNAQALALRGFLLAAQNKTREAIGWFDQALAIDPGLGNAWLGRGLCRIRRGDLSSGREDLLIAAATEPQRAALRSYLAKAWSESGENQRAMKELQLAKALDPNDPTAWLYSALLNEQGNHINEAIGDLEKSQELNTNRAVYRSQLLLDQDRAVRGANLARIYQEAGMDELALREAGKSIAADYANYSTHLFLANTYDQLRDPNSINLRYETPAESEYLIANLLAPAGAGTLSPSISQQEYSKLLDRDGFGISSSTEYLSRGAWTQSSELHYTSGNTSYAFDTSYPTDPGQRLNNDFDGKQFSLQFKHQLTAKDSVYLQASRSDFGGGDLNQHYDPATQEDSGLRVNELQEPFLALGYHREWQPGVHTLILGSYLKDTYQVSDSGWQGIELSVSNGLPTFARSFGADQTYQSTVEFHSIESQQIFQQPRGTEIFGVLYQGASYSLNNLLELPFPIGGILPDPPADQSFETDFQRVSTYFYQHWQIVQPLQLIGGLTYDHLKFPENFRSAPLSGRTGSTDRWSPKAGFVWTPTLSTTLRGAWTRSLAGASLDQSLHLEPTEMAGFNQSFRSIAPESVVGSTAGTRFETFDVSLEHKFPSRTYVGLSAELLKSSVVQPIGVFALNYPDDVAGISSTRERLDFREQTAAITIDQLVGDWVALSASYRISQASLRDDLVDLGAATPTNPGYPVYPRYHPTSTLQKVTAQAVLNHPSGFSAGIYGTWYGQDNSGTLAPPSDRFVQVNLLGGYRSPRHHFRLQLGVLNLTGQDYHLDPLNYYNELPHRRTFVTRFQWNF